MPSLGEEEPALHKETKGLRKDCGKPRVTVPENTAQPSSSSGTANVRIKNKTFAALKTRRGAPWKNSRVLNEPPVKPMDFCTTRSEWMPIAD